MNTLKLILVLNFSSLGWFSFSSAVNSCYQLLTAVTKKMNGIFIYPLKLILVPNFSSPGCLGARLESVTDTCTYGHTHRPQVKIVLTQPCLDDARAWVGQFNLSCLPGLDKMCNRATSGHSKENALSVNISMYCSSNSAEKSPSSRIYRS